MLRRALPAAILLIGVLATSVGGTTVASFSGTATGGTNQFSTGTVDLSQSPTSALLAVTDLVPGETVTSPLTVTNSGSLASRYALASTVTNTDGKGVGAQLTLTVKTGVTACTNAGFGSTGTVVYGSDGPLGALGASLDLVGTSSAYPNGGRTLASGANETLCFQLTLPSGTSTSYQGAATTATFSFVTQQL